MESIAKKTADKVHPAKKAPVPYMTCRYLLEAQLAEMITNDTPFKIRIHGHHKNFESAKLFWKKRSPWVHEIDNYSRQR
jgi:hypothetical protein